LLDQVTTG
jgi:hypothetical protein